MNNIITKLSDKLLSELKMADEIWIAVALLSSTGLRLISDNLPIGCIQHYLVGIDLPTDPKALWTLYEKQLKSDLKVKVKLYTNRKFYHPKLYLIRKGNSFKGFVGSANCTNGGLNNNIELSVCIDDQKTCKQLKEWFGKLTDEAIDLLPRAIQTHQAKYDERKKKKREDERIAKQEKQELNEEFEATLKERLEFIKVLKMYRHNDKEYNEVKKERITAVNELRLSLGYPTFNIIDVDCFFDIWELGHVLAFPKPTIKREIGRFISLLKMLCDEKLDIVVRYNRALVGDMKIKGVSEGLISKVLVIHNPNLYFVKNGKSDAALRKYGIDLPRGLSKGEKYKITCQFLRQICKETDIDNLAVLDYYLYLEGLAE